MNVSKCERLCYKNNLSHVYRIIKPGNRDQYTTIASICELDHMVRESLKTIAESNEPNLSSKLPANIEDNQLISYIAIGLIPYGAMALHKLGYKTNPKNPPRRNKNGCMKLRMKHTEYKYTYIHNVQPYINNYTTLWYELNAIETNEEIYN